MKRLLAIAILALAVPAVALAKGASEATIEGGPGLNGAVTVPGNGEDGGASPLGRLAELAGFFPAVFAQTPNPMLTTRRPGIDLGPRYTIRYVVPGPGAASIIRQDLYPYARPFPISYTKPGQVFWDGQRTFGGWYQSTPELKQTLIEVGLPATAPSGGGGGFWSSTPQLVGVFGGIAAAALAVGALAFLVRRRRLQPAPTS